MCNFNQILKVYDLKRGNAELLLQTKLRLVACCLKHEGTLLIIPFSGIVFAVL